MAKKKNKKDDFGWNKGKTWNDPSKSHGDKGESTKYSFKLNGKAKPRKAWCSPGSAEVIKKSQSVGRPYGYKPIYDQTDTYNYQSEEARYRRALERSPDLILSKLYLYRASDGCYNHIVIPPDFTYEDFLDVIEKIPWEFAVTAPPEFWLNFPAPSEPRPGQPLIPPDLSWNTPGSGFPGYPIPKFGCTNPEAENYDPEAEIDDGSCILPSSGCTDPEADNYDPNAVYNNGSCVYPEDDEPPEGPCDPPTCTLGPEYNSRWVVVDEATALSGGGCPVGYDNYGYAELADGTFQVLCQYIESAGSTFQRLWYRYPGEDWVKVDSSAGGLSSSCQDDEAAYTVNWREVGSSEWNTVTSDSPITWTQEYEKGKCPVDYQLRASRFYFGDRTVSTNWIRGPITSQTFTKIGEEGSYDRYSMELVGTPTSLSSSVSFLHLRSASGPTNLGLFRRDSLSDNCGDCITTFSTGLVISRPQCIEVTPELSSTGLKKFEVKDNNGTLVSKKTKECPTVYLSCERPGDTPQSLDPKKIQDPRCPFVEEDE